jgi:hypothetical protein
MRESFEAQERHHILRRTNRLRLSKSAHVTERVRLILNASAMHAYTRFKGVDGYCHPGLECDKNAAFETIVRH